MVMWENLKIMSIKVNDMKHLEFKGKYKEDLLSGRKKATIRKDCNLKKGEVVVVHCGGEMIGEAIIESVEKKWFEELSDEDAKRDGFESLEELKEELLSCYGSKPEEVYVIRFTLFPFQQAKRPEAVYYGERDLKELAKEALEKLKLKDEERKLLELYLQAGSIKRAAAMLDGSFRKNRNRIREALRKAYRKLEKQTGR